ncbi:hypothetical protein BDN72DRAFT_834548 [Pluteus cervinus]|uniref:Uncharacterized protein n=1 Tax=Pluteus cervinus TaxID=181527 RepID=A0ACD3B6Q1_9AGAR|nr:hypothetical protein BDN72DRAFT_834548 [Pluteus cervinus]
MPSQGDGHPRVLPVTLIFDLLQLLALVLLVLVASSAMLSRRVHRMRTWYSFLLSWIIYTIAFLLLPFKSPDFEPDRATCLFQASMIYATPPTASWAGLCFVIEAYSRIRLVLGVSELRPWQSMTLLIVPLFVMAGVVAEVYLLGMNNIPAIRMEPTFLYCHLDLPQPAIISAALCSVSMAGCIVMFAIIAMMAFRNWEEVKANSMDSNSPNVTPSVMIRIWAFIMFPMIAMGVTLSFPSPSESAGKWNLLLPLMPLSAALIFGTQRDIISSLSSLMCCKRS